MRAFAASLFVVLMVAGCSDQEPEGRVASPATATATATPTVVRGQPGSVAPPSAYLLDAGGTPIEAGTGTYCWKLGSEGMCRDFAGPRTNVEPILLAPATSLEFQFDVGMAREVTVDWTRAEEMQSSPGQDNRLDWAPRDGTNYRGPAYTDSLTAPVEPGLYVLAVFALFPEGDVTYGFYIDVR
jgi:hypothetical protein